MYFSRRMHLLSYCIMASALIQLAGSMIEGVIRMAVNRSGSFAPDMADIFLWRVQVGVTITQILAIAAVFFLSLKKLVRLKSVIEDDDYQEMGRLQEEFFEDRLSSLSADAIGQLLQIWAVILTGAECIYCVSSMIYRRFTIELMLALAGGAAQGSFVSIYNLTHGFKYLEMMTAILLGVVMTAIFLKDRFLRMVAVAVAVLFLFSFGVFQMQTISLPSGEVGIVWTSVIFHLTETIGLFSLSLYLSKHYRGL